VPQIAPKKHAVALQLWQSKGVALQKAEETMVHYARNGAWSWVTSSTLVNPLGGVQPPNGYPV